MEIIKQEFGLNLEKLLKEQRISVKELACALNVSPKTVNEWVGKNGRSPRNPEVLRNIANFLNISVYFLLYGEEDPKNSVCNLMNKFQFNAGVYEVTIVKK